jgi:hypothetical protein
VWAPDPTRPRSRAVSCRRSSQVVPADPFFSGPRPPSFGPARAQYGHGDVYANSQAVPRLHAGHSLRPERRAAASGQKTGSDEAGAGDYVEARPEPVGAGCRSRCSICGCDPLGQVAGGSCSTCWKASAVLSSSWRRICRSCPRESGTSAPGCWSPGRQWGSKVADGRTPRGLGRRWCPGSPVEGPGRQAEGSSVPLCRSSDSGLSMRVRRHRPGSGRSRTVSGPSPPLVPISVMLVVGRGEARPSVPCSAARIAATAGLPE